MPILLLPELEDLADGVSIWFEAKIGTEHLSKSVLSTFVLFTYGTSQHFTKPVPVALPERPHVGL